MSAQQAQASTIAYLDMPSGISGDMFLGCLVAAGWPLDALHAAGQDDVIVVPIGFISDHMEVLFDLDEEAVERAAALGMTMVRAATVGVDPVFVAMIRELIQERFTANPARRALGSRGPNHDVCPLNCCLRGDGRPGAAAATA